MNSEENNEEMGTATAGEMSTLYCGGTITSGQSSDLTGGNTNYIDDADFEKALAEYLGEIKRLSDAYFKAHLSNLPPDTFTVERGSKWIRVVTIGYGDLRQKRVHSFVAAQDVNTKNLWAKKGDIMKAATWKLPAKHPRGSIFIGKGAPAMDERGWVMYLK